MATPPVTNDVKQGAGAPGFLARVKMAALELVRAHEAGNGAGPDDYWAKPMPHAMADGKYLSALAELRRANVISEALFQKAATRAARRLAESAVPGYGGGIAWGLNFPWAERPADEAYLVTTALVARGLKAAQKAGASIEFELLERTGRSLIAWPRAPLAGMQVAVYSANIARPIYNAAAQWLLAMADLALTDDDCRPEDFLLLLRNRRVPGYGWVYEEGGNRMDLLHCCYLTEFCHDLGSKSEADDWLLQTITQFRASGQYTDAFDRLALEEARRRGNPLGLTFIESFATLDLGKPARAWSLGQALQCLSNAMHEESPVMRGLARTVAENILSFMSSKATDIGPRHAMHVLHGLATLLRRERASSNSQTNHTSGQPE